VEYFEISDGLLKEIYRHAGETYPRECFGYLIGEPGGLRIRGIERGTNMAPVERNDRFEMDPREFLRLERRLDEQELGVLGYYHSHPDWPAIPSQTDLEWAHPGFAYLIASVSAAGPLQTQVWLLQNSENDRKGFIPCPIMIVEDEVDSDERSEQQEL
jgi:proteasome lid subunit RPN8/RPN11